MAFIEPGAPTTRCLDIVCVIAVKDPSKSNGIESIAEVSQTKGRERSKANEHYYYTVVALL